MWETMEHKRREGRQDLGKADTPSKTQHTCNETIGDRGKQTLARRTHHPTQAHLCGDHERQASNTNSHVGRHWETRGGKTSGKRMHHLWRGSERQPYNYRHTCGKTMGDSRKQEFGKVDTPSNTGPNIRGDKGRQGETRPREGRHAIHGSSSYLPLPWRQQPRRANLSSYTPSPRQRGSWGRRMRMCWTQVQTIAAMVVWWGSVTPSTCAFGVSPQGQGTAV